MSAEQQVSEVPAIVIDAPQEKVVEALDSPKEGVKRRTKRQKLVDIEKKYKTVKTAVLKKELSGIDEYYKRVVKSLGKTALMAIYEDHQRKLNKKHEKEMAARAKEAVAPVSEEKKDQ